MNVTSVPLVVVLQSTMSTGWRCVHSWHSLTGRLLPHVAEVLDRDVSEVLGYVLSRRCCSRPGRGHRGLVGLRVHVTVGPCGGLTAYQSAGDPRGIVYLRWRWQSYRPGVMSAVFIVAKFTSHSQVLQKSLINEPV